MVNTVEVPHILGILSGINELVLNRRTGFVIMVTLYWLPSLFIHI